MHKIPSHHLLIAAALLAAVSSPARAIMVGQVDTFQNGAVSGWISGAAHPLPPSVVTGGGPAGSADNYLLLQATGLQGAGGKLVAFNREQWTGDYNAAGISAITMDLRNFGATDLLLRLYVDGPNGSTGISTMPISLAAGSGWATVSFAMTPDALSGLATTALSGVTQLHLFHALSPFYPGQNIATQLGVDNISAVPEPAAWALLASGLLLACGARARRAHGARRSV